MFSSGVDEKRHAEHLFNSCGRVDWGRAQRRDVTFLMSVSIPRDLTALTIPESAHVTQHHLRRHDNALEDSW